MCLYACINRRIICECNGTLSLTHKISIKQFSFKKLKVKTMKKLAIAVLFISSFYLVGCKSDTVTNPIGGGGGTGNVTFTVSTAAGSQQDLTNFLFKPSVNITVTTVVVSLVAQSFTFTETNPAPDVVFNPTDGFQIEDYQGVAAGQQWTFKITGKIGSSTGQAYDVTVNYTTQ